MLPLYGTASPFPDFDAMKKSWRKASPSQKFFRTGIIGGTAAAVIYTLFFADRRPRATPASPGLSPAPALPSGRGTYR